MVFVTAYEKRVAYVIHYQAKTNGRRISAIDW